MMPEKRKNVLPLIAVLIVSFVAVLVIAVIYKCIRTTDNIGGISYMHGTYIIDTTDLREVIGNADYVFVGNVVSEDGTVYKFPVMVEDENGNEYEVASPYTNFTVEIQENIKGNLNTEYAIPIQKAGGLAQDGSGYFVYEDDILPEVGSTYVFFAFAQPDGSLLIAGANSNIELPAATGVMAAGESANVYDEVLEAFETQIETNRERFVSIYAVD